MTPLHAVVMAAGEGRRLRPLTERWPKPVLPIDGRPIVATLMHELARAGFARVTVVIGHLGKQLEALLGDGTAFGLTLAYAHQPEPLGSADAVRRALGAGGRPPLLVTAADTVWTRGDIARAAERWLASGAAGGLGVRDVPAEELPDRSSVHVEHGRVLEIAEHPRARGSGRACAGAPLWLLGEELARSLDSLPGPPFELSLAFQNAIERGREICALPLGPTRDLTHPEDVVTENFPYLSESP